MKFIPELMDEVILVLGARYADSIRASYPTATEEDIKGVIASNMEGIKRDAKRLYDFTIGEMEDELDNNSYYNI